MNFGASSPVQTHPIPSLIGLTLPSGWKVVKDIQRPGGAGAEDLTGSWFSIGYIAEKAGKQGFLKVIDIARALDERMGGTFIERLKSITDAHSFECTVLDICKSARMDRVVHILDKGELPPPPGALLPFPLPFILFELADGDVRKIVSRTASIDDAWRLKVLHDVAVGLQQLHTQGIAHQDLKPSNVLVFDARGDGAKIGDLGRATCATVPAAHDMQMIAGAWAYAPPEQIYGIAPAREVDRRNGCDLYHLGTLAMFIFAGVTPTPLYVQKLPPEVLPRPWGGRGDTDYYSALPLLTATFTAILEEVRNDLPEWAREELSQLILNACHPDYEKRGDPNARMRVGSPLGLEEFVSRFDRLAKRALVEARK
ncbi:protein kinase [Niveibacterium sp.]|uniref:protein kinase domain-containing protein n=1 Tax=Niveibacterium sp. TaxID=2017444 RepID=UPI0035B1B880